MVGDEQGVRSNNRALTLPPHGILSSIRRAALARFLWGLPLLFSPSPMVGQEEISFRPEEIVRLLREGVSPTRISTLVVGGCVVDGALPVTQRALEEEGATPALRQVVARFRCESGPIPSETSSEDPEVRAPSSEALALLRDRANAAIRDGDYPRLRAACAQFIEDHGAANEVGDDLANLLFARAFEDGVQVEEFDLASAVLRIAREFATSERLRQQVDFWLGYSVYRVVVNDQGPADLRGAEGVLFDLEEARTLLRSARSYASAQGLTPDLEELLTSIDGHIRIQEDVIQRAERPEQSSKLTGEPLRAPSVTEALATIRDFWSRLLSTGDPALLSCLDAGLPFFQRFVDRPADLKMLRDPQTLSTPSLSGQDRTARVRANIQLEWETPFGPKRREEFEYQVLFRQVGEDWVVTRISG